jgi:hypothetical protein
MKTILNDLSRTSVSSSAVILSVLSGMAGCSGNDNNADNGANPITGQTAAQSALVCDESMKTAFKPDANTTVLLVKAFKKGDPLLLTGSATSTTPLAGNDVCVVKLNVGPGNPGPADAPSTSPGIGIEVWLPTQANWNNRIHVKGGGGWAGAQQASLTVLAGTSPDTAGYPADTAMREGAVSASTDTGHVGNPPTIDGSFTLNPDGTINMVLWKDFSERSMHEMALKTKALTKAYYGKDAKFSYWNGFSTGGRQAMKEAQANPADFDGILAGAPAMNWTKFQTSQLYMQLAQIRDTGSNMSPAQLDLLSNAAINACDVVGGRHLGYIPDPSQCRYDPTTDVSVFCQANGGTNTTSACVNPIQANAVNKMWYGMTADGSVPSPATDNGLGKTTTGNQRWWGLNRGTTLLGLGGPSPFPISTDWVAIELQNPTIGGPTLKNATGNGANGWKSLSYTQLSNAFDRGVALDPAFANINTDNPDLSAFRDRGGKLISYHGLADQLIFPQGTVNYYERVLAQMGGLASVQNFYRLYLVPGMGHGLSNGTSNPAANPPLPAADQLYALLTGWVEQGTAPGRVDIQTAATTSNPVIKSRPICLYPQKATYTNGDPNLAASYTCT